MALIAGTRLGAYEIVAPLGAGGMGEVYRARDTKLNREVAIKVLLASVASDPERLARFSREAHLLASLNHPNIAHIHGLEDSDGVPALVMELVEGPTLAEIIAGLNAHESAQSPRITAPSRERGATERGGGAPRGLEKDIALPIAKQIAEALEAAHEQGVIHRDLKPANIKVRADGTVKVLDFGLAKALDPAGASSADATMSPTISMHATQAGVILGTAAYMAPEQARGKVVDKRADIWAFGCVLFEMLAGRRAFASDDVTDTIVAVLSKEPDWQALPATASSVRPLIARCLRKDPKQRLQAIGDARLDIDELIGGTSEEVTATRAAGVTPRRRVAQAAIAGLVGGALAAALVTFVVTRPASPPRVPLSRFEIVPPPAQLLALQGADRDIAISPDGQYIVYRAGGLAQLVVRAIDRVDARPLSGITNARQPFFSPDSRWIGFFDGASLKKVSVTGGPAVTICQSPSTVPRGASWGDDNSIVFATQDSSRGLLRVSAGGGEPTVLTTPDQAKGEKNHWFPSVLPGSRGVLFTINGAQRPEAAQIAVLDLQKGQRRTLSRGSQAEYLETGHLLYVAAGTLHAVRFDLGRLEVMSDPTPVVEDALMVTNTGAGNYAISRHGTLIYVPAAVLQTPRSLVWVNRRGQQTPLRAPPRMYADLRLSPDATHVALSIRDQEDDIWIWNFAREGLTRLTSGPGVDSGPVWTADGQRLVFGSRRGGAPNLFAQAVNGTGIVERLTTSSNPQFPAFVAPDGTSVVGSDQSPQTAADVVRFPLNSPVGRSAPDSLSVSGTTNVEPLVRTPFIEFNPAISPDMRYLAYQSNESGLEEIYVRPFPNVSDGRWQVSTSGGTRPVWSRDGRELFYIDAANTLTAVPVQASGSAFAPGIPVRLFKAVATTSLNYSDRFYDVSPDGRRFLMIKENAPEGHEAPAPRVVVVLNWLEELKARVPH